MKPEPTFALLVTCHWRTEFFPGQKTEDGKKKNGKRSNDWRVWARNSLRSPGSPASLVLVTREEAKAELRARGIAP
jgi:hypothetical protein